MTLTQLFAQTVVKGKTICFSNNMELGRLDGVGIRNGPSKRSSAHKIKLLLKLLSKFLVGWVLVYSCLHIFTSAYVLSFY